MALAFPVLRVMSLVTKPMGDDPVHRVLADEGVIDVLFALMNTWFTQVCCNYLRLTRAFCSFLLGLTSFSQTFLLLQLTKWP